MRKDDYWLSRILRDGEARYLERVLRPALADLERTRAHFAERMSETTDAEASALFQAEIERIDTVDTRLRGHFRDTLSRFSRRQARPPGD